jgi:hypothetical protein
MNRTFSPKAIQRGLCLGALLLSAAAASADTQLTFQVDMTAQVTAGTFTNGTATVSAHGTFDGWGSGLNLTNNPAPNTNLYTGTADDTSDANGNVVIYKYVVGGTYESTADGQNRCAQLPAGGGSLLLPASFYNDAGPTNTANVTFQVDMAEQIRLGNFNATTGSVEVHGGFNSWSGGSTLTNIPAILTTNAIGVVTSNVYVGTFAITGPTNGTGEFKYVMQPGTGWESPSGSDSDFDNGNNRFYIITPQTLPIVSFSDAALAFPQLMFQVDMTAQVDGGTFTPGTDTVSVHGTFNGWGAGVSLTNTNGTNPNLYTGSTYDTADANAGVLIYKYVTNGGGYENTLSGNNRCAQLPSGGGSVSLPEAFFSDAGVAINANVTFQVDMAEQVHLGNFDTNAGAYVEVRGYFNGWGGGSTLVNDPTILTTNATGIVTSNVYVGTFEMTGSTNGTEEFKYVMQPGTAYEGPNASDSDRDNNNNRFFVITEQTLPIVSFGDRLLSFTSVTNDVTFEIDMTTQMAVQNFSTNNGNTVEIHGDFNNWAGAQTMTNDPASSTPNIYSTVITYVDTGGAEHYFKYVIQPGTQWETVSAPNNVGGNRHLNLLQSNGSFTNGPVYFSDESPSALIDFVTVTNCMVTFTVDMTNGTGTGPGGSATFDNTYPSSDAIYINGMNNGINNSFWTWGGLGNPAYQMTQVPNTMLFTITVPVKEGQNELLVYKYSINGLDDEAPTGANHNRWIRSLPNYTMPVDTYGSQGTANQTEIGFGNLAIAQASNNQIQLSWLGRNGVEVQTATSLSAHTVWTSQPLTDGTNLLVGPGGMASTNYPTGQGSLFYRLVGPQ